MSKQEVIEKLAAALHAAQNGNWAEVIIVAEGANGDGWVGFTGGKVRALGLVSAADAVIRAQIASESRALPPTGAPTLAGPEQPGGIKVN